LKLAFLGTSEIVIGVAPRAGAWIETAAKLLEKYSAWSRPPRGGVD